MNNEEKNKVYITETVNNLTLGLKWDCMHTFDPTY